MSVDLPCYRCGYDLRAHPPDGQCPECQASVAESRRVAAIPRRPRWRDSDPRWRRRMLAGVWLLVLLPLMNVMRASEWAASVPVPALFDYGVSFRTLDETFLANMSVYPTLVFCIGVTLLFSKERGRRRSPLDWTRRWGALCSFVVLLLSAAQILFLVALVLVGISAVFVCMPPKYQPAATDLLARVSSAWLRSGPHPKESSTVTLVAFSSIAMLLACVPLYDALRSSGPKRLAAVVLAPLAFFSLMHLGQAGQCYLVTPWTPTNVYPFQTYFSPELLLANLGISPRGVNAPASVLNPFGVEAVKWFTVLAIAAWLSIAQIATWRQGTKTSLA
jgi:hypothetical protein